MNKHLTNCIAIITCLISASAVAAPGEYWEITSKMEMPGMPFAMPATTQKVCISKGGENDPQKSSGDKDCQMSDIKTSGNKVSWKVRCNHNGEVMTGTGEQTSTPNSYQGKMQFSGKSQGRDMNMTSIFSGKHIGGSCDSEEMANKYKRQAKEQQDAMCDTSKFDTKAWITNSGLLDEQTCPGKKQQMCDAVRKDAPRDAEVYRHLVTTDGHNKGLIAKTCGLNMDATTKAICKTVNSKNYRTLSSACPSEAKAFRELQRRKECEGRSYTSASRADSIKKCLSGGSGNDDSDQSSDDGASYDAPAQGKSGQSGKSSSNSNPANDVIEGAKTLKGLFGF